MAYSIGAKLTEVYSSSELASRGDGFGAGDYYMDQSGNKYVFVQASGTVSAYDVVAVNSSFVAQAATSALAQAGNTAAVALATLSSGSWGWAQIRGAVSVNVLQTCSSNTALYTTATAGKLDDTSTSQVKVQGITILANNATTGTVASMALLATEPFFAI